MAWAEGRVVVHPSVQRILPQSIRQSRGRSTFGGLYSRRTWAVALVDVSCSGQREAATLLAKEVKALPWSCLDIGPAVMGVLWL
jgi:hypothetical protein